MDKINNQNKLTTFMRSPTPPTIRISLGFSIGSGMVSKRKRRENQVVLSSLMSMKRLIASTVIEKQRAIRKTALTRAPTT